MLLKKFWIIFLLFTCGYVYAQTKPIGRPFIKNYSKSEYAAGIQSWMIDISNKGLVYFANNDGLLEFDGKNWLTYPLSSSSVLRSIKVDEDGRIYVGAFNEFGYFLSDNNGKLKYVQLQNLVPENFRNFDEVWRIFIVPQGVVFQSFKQLMVYDGEKINVIPAPNQFHFSFLVNGEIYVNDQKDGLLRLYGNRLVRVPGTEEIKGEQIVNILTKNDNLLIVTSEKGILEYDGVSTYKWVSPASQFLIHNQAYCGIKINPSQYAFGTVQSGLMICDTAGNILQQINRKNGLQNNTVLCLKLDQYQNLWLGLDNGIDYVEINSPLSYISYSEGISAGYAAVLHDGILYLGTNQGVFAKSWNDLQNGTTAEFQLIPQTQGQVWKLQVVDNELLCGHNSGTFSIKGMQATKISNVNGGWAFVKLDGYEDILIEGTYSGLSVFKKENGKWVFHHLVKGYNESSRFIENAGNNQIWISHGYKGVFKVRLNETLDSAMHVDFYNSERGFPTDFGINVFEFRGKPVFTTREGIYVYDIQSNSIQYSKEINTLFNFRKPNVIYEDEQGNVWYFENNNLGVLKRQEDGSFFELSIPFRKLDDTFIKGFQFVYSINNNHVLFGTQDGFVDYLPKYQKNYQTPFRTFIRKVKLSNPDSIIYFGEKIENTIIPDKIPFNFNGLQFTYSANDYENENLLLFSSQLEGYESAWSAWEKRDSREFTNLRNGDYRFRVKAQNIYGVESGIAQIEFSILPPWYLSKAAIVIYVLMLILFLGVLFRLLKYRISILKKREEEKQKQIFIERERQLMNEALIADKELIKLRNDKLRAEMLQKNKELANTTLLIVQKNKSLMKIKSDLEKLKNENPDEMFRMQAKALIKRINKDIQSEQQWKLFERHFENVHEEFLKRIKSTYPNLSPNELKLCAYLRMNTTSKEIAALMNISIRGVEISRYRLRKKLNLSTEDNLTDFILSF